jgi:hypothetical protein
MRFREYRNKFSELLDIYAQLELLYPDVQTYKILEHSPNTRKRANAEAGDLEKIIMIHALDMLYFWMYQPRSRSALKQFSNTLSEDERYILLSSQFSLQRHREISLMFIDNILGTNFQRPLSFYLSRYEGYLEDIKRLVLDQEFGNANIENGLDNSGISPPAAIDSALEATGELTRPLDPACVIEKRNN